MARRPAAIAQWCMPCGGKVTRQHQTRRRDLTSPRPYSPARQPAEALGPGRFNCPNRVPGVSGRLREQSGHQLEATVHTDFAKNRLQVVLDCVTGDTQIAGDCVRVQALDDQYRQLAFTPA